MHYAVEAEQLTGLLSLLSVAGCDVNVKDKVDHTRVVVNTKCDPVLYMFHC